MVSKDIANSPFYSDSDSSSKDTGGPHVYVRRNKKMDGNNDKSSASMRSCTQEKESSKNLSQEAGPSQPIEVAATKEEPHCVSRDDMIAEPLEKLISSKLHALFKSAIERITEFGYSKKDVEKSLCSQAIYGRGHNVIANMVNHTLAFLNSSSSSRTNPPREPDIEDLQQLVDYRMLEMVNVLREFNPSLSVGEALWRLLVCDTNIFEACTWNGDPNSFVNSEEIYSTGRRSSMPKELRLIDPKNLPSCDSLLTVAQAIGQSIASGEKPRSSQEVGPKKKSMAVLEKKYKVYGNPALISKLREQKLPLKSASLKTKQVGAASAPSSGNESHSKLVVPTKPENSFCVSDYYTGIPFDESTGKYVPRNERDEMILKLAELLEQLKREIDRWTKWANTKVMQATMRLKKEQAELKKLRQEIELLKKEKQELEDNNEKRLREEESALTYAYDQIEKIAITKSDLEMEGFKLKQQLQAAKQEEQRAAALCKEALRGEEDLRRDAKNLEHQKIFLQDELQSETKKADDLQRDINEAKKRVAHAQALDSEMRQANEELLAHAATMRREREKLEADYKAEEENLKKKAEMEETKYLADSRQLRSKIALLRLQEISCRPSKLQMGKDGIFNSSMTADGGTSYRSSVGKKTGRFSGTASSRRGLKVERECVMCLSKERSVVFLPCAHQVLCRDCNEAHQMQGMTDCPSCRRSIERRIQARFARG